MLALSQQAERVVGRSLLKEAFSSEQIHVVTHLPPSSPGGSFRSEEHSANHRWNRGRVGSQTPGFYSGSTTNGFDLGHVTFLL